MSSICLSRVGYGTEVPVEVFCDAVSCWSKDKSLAASGFSRPPPLTQHNDEVAREL